MASLVEEHEQFKGRIEEVKGKFEPAPVDPPRRRHSPRSGDLKRRWGCPRAQDGAAPRRLAQLAQGQEGYEQRFHLGGGADDESVDERGLNAYRSQTGEPPFEPSATAGAGGASTRSLCRMD